MQTQRVSLTKHASLESEIKMAGKVGQLLNSLAGWPVLFPTLGVRLSYAVIVLQAVLCAAAAVTLVGLYGDGAWFTFAVADGDPWILKWSMLASRASNYVTVVVPAELIATIFRLDGTHIAMTYGFLFGLVQLVQFTVCVAIARRRYPELLLFPVAHYVFANALGFGFMSEALLGPGFFWIGFFLLITRPSSLWWFTLCFAGLVFAHELMLPSAIMLAAFGWYQQRGANRLDSFRFEAAILPAICIMILVAWVAIRLAGGGADSDQNAITTFDPRRLINNPTLIMIVGAGVLLFLACWKGHLRLRPVSVGIVAVALCALPTLLRPWINFGLGRYDSARTLIGCELLVFGAWAILAYKKRSSLRQPQRSFILQTMVPMLLVAALAINLGSSLAFLWDWTIARQAFAQLARPEIALSAGTEKDPVYLPYDQATRFLTQRQIAANNRMGFSWTWPFRFAVLAHNYRPAIVLYDPSTLYYLCHVLRPDHRQDTSPTTTVVAELRPLACSANPPPYRRRFFQRLFDKIRAI